MSNEPKLRGFVVRHVRLVHHRGQPVSQYRYLATLGFWNHRDLRWVRLRDAKVYDRRRDAEAMKQMLQKFAYEDHELDVIPRGDLPAHPPNDP